MHLRNAHAMKTIWVNILIGIIKANSVIQTHHICSIFGKKSLQSSVIAGYFSAYIMSHTRIKSKPMSF